MRGFRTRGIPGVILFVVLLAFLQPDSARGQEFDCSVSVDYRNLTGSDFGFLQDLEQRAEEYINQRSWTDHRFRPNERIDCSMQIVVEDALSLTSFQARLIVALRRPIYNTTQHTVVVQFNDQNWQFSYAQGQPLVFNLERYDPLTSVLDYYAYVLLGYDFDTFSTEGGTPYFRQARRIAERARSQSAPGWSEVGSDRSRESLVTQIMDPRFEPLREAYFSYHFDGLDRFVTDTDGARSAILEVLRSLDELSDDVSRQYVLDLFFSAKYSELPDIFEGWSRSSEAYDLLTRLDPSHTSDYEQLVN